MLSDRFRLHTHDWWACTPLQLFVCHLSCVVMWPARWLHVQAVLTWKRVCAQECHSCDSLSAQSLLNNHAGGCALYNLLTHRIVRFTTQGESPSGPTEEGGEGAAELIPIRVWGTCRRPSVVLLHCVQLHRMFLHKVWHAHSNLTVPTGHPPKKRIRALIQTFFPCHNTLELVLQKENRSGDARSDHC